jgi:hypothetical protein
MPMSGCQHVSIALYARPMPQGEVETYLADPHLTPQSVATNEPCKRPAEKGRGG